MINWSKIELVQAITSILYLDFKIIWHGCSFETFVQIS